MQQTGTLKKRKKRNLAKVNGLSTVAYDEKKDFFDGTYLYGTEVPRKPSDRLAISSGIDTRLRMSEIMGRSEQLRRISSSNSDRITRNPMFHSPSIEIDIDLNEEGEDNLPKLESVRVNEATESIHDRPCLLDEATMNRLQMLLILGATSGAFPWYWNKQKYRVEKWSPRFESLWTIQWFFVTVQTALLTIFQFFSFFDRVSGTDKSYREIFMNSLSVYWYICAVYFNVNMYKYKEQIRHYINTMLKFNKEYVDKYLIHLDGCKDGGRILINLSIPSNCSQVFASVALFLVMPYQPWYLFHYIYPKPWYWLIPGAIQEFIVVGQVITSYMLTAWIVVAHANSVEFWLRESHNYNDSDFTTDEIRRPNKAVETYKALQVLCTCFNDCMSPLAIPLVKIHIMTGLIPCGFVLIRSMNQLFIDEFPGILTYPIGVIDCATAGFAMMSMGAQMFDLAVSFVDSWSRTRHKNFRRILMACPTLKVKVGRMYYMTVSTTITFFKVTFDLITDCIITFK